MSLEVLKSLIQSIPDWQSLTASQVWEALSSLSIKKTDPNKWKSIDLAKLIGWNQVDDFFVYLADNKCQWVVNLAAGDGLAIGDDPINAVLKSFNNPVCQQLAELGIHYVSILEDHGLSPTQEEVSQVLCDAQCEEAHKQRQQSLLIAGSFRWNAYVDAVNNLKPNDPDPKL